MPIYRPYLFQNTIMPSDLTQLAEAEPMLSESIEPVVNLPAEDAVPDSQSDSGIKL